MSCGFIIQFVNMINCINFPCRGDDFSFVSIKSAAHWPWMESMSDCGSVLSVAELMEWAILIVSADRKYFECLTELQRTVINNWSPRSDPCRTPESPSEGGK